MDRFPKIFETYLLSSTVNYLLQDDDGDGIKLISFPSKPSPNPASALERMIGQPFVCC